MIYHALLVNKRQCDADRNYMYAFNLTLLIQKIKNEPYLNLPKLPQTDAAPLQCVKNPVPPSESPPVYNLQEVRASVAVKKWEHKTLNLGNNSEDPDEILCALGLEGWELVTYSGETSNNYALAVFKRPLP